MQASNIKRCYKCQKFLRLNNFKIKGNGDLVKICKVCSLKDRSRRKSKGLSHIDAKEQLDNGQKKCYTCGIIFIMENHDQVIINCTSCRDKNSQYKTNRKNNYMKIIKVGKKKCENCGKIRTLDNFKRGSTAITIAKICNICEKRKSDREKKIVSEYKQINENTEKYCKQCKKFKAISCFKNKRGTDNRMLHSCNICRAKYNRGNHKREIINNLTKEIDILSPNISDSSSEEIAILTHDIDSQSNNNISCEDKISCEEMTLSTYNDLHNDFFVYIESSNTYENIDHPYIDNKESHEPQIHTLYNEELCSEFAEYEIDLDNLLCVNVS